MNAQLRAGLIALHLFAITAMALPSAGSGIDRRLWKQQTVQDEFAAWTARLNGLGWQGDSEQLQDIAYEVAVGWEKARGTVLKPFEPYYTVCGTWQSWKMFVAPHRYPGRLHIDLMIRGEWQTVYVARSSEHTWLASKLDHDRFRSAIFRYAWPNYRNGYRQFVRWLAAEAARDYPKATQLRTRFRRFRTPSPDEVRSGKEDPGRWDLTETVKLR